MMNRQTTKKERRIAAVNESVESTKHIESVCLRLLAQRDHSILELSCKLKSKGFDDVLIDQVIAELIGNNRLNEHRYVENHTRQRISKGYGPKRIEYELKRAGIGDFDIESVLSEMAGDWMSAITKVYQKKFSQELSLTPNEWAKRSRFLQQRGFSGSMISALFKTLNIRFE